MTVYVDDMRAPYRRMIMCHMIADTRAELDNMAAKIGVSIRWRQSSGNHGEHYDICLSKRALAVRYGAIEISTRELAEKCVARKGAKGKQQYLG